MHKLLLPVFVLMLTACQQGTEPAEAPDAAAETPEPAASAPVAEQDSLAAVLAAQPDETKARYVHRHPKETLEFFGIEPGMTVVEALPGRGWYTKLLLPFLGSEGHLVGANYAVEMYPLFSFVTEEMLAQQKAWLVDWPAGAEEWRGETGATIAAFHFGSMPDEMAGTADAAFFARVLHNLARFETAGEGDFLTVALADTYNALKPGGILGVVQHHARDDMPDDWADGSNGYLKKQFVIDQVEAAGFEFVAESDINANEKDQPTTDDIVWRLPPTLFTSKDNLKLQAQYEAVGESNRMTLKFRKPE